MKQFFFVEVNHSFRGNEEEIKRGNWLREKRRKMVCKMHLKGEERGKRKDERPSEREKRQKKERLFESGERMRKV